MRASVTYLTPVECADRTPRGELTAAARFEFVDAAGNQRGRNVRVHKEYSATMEEAKGSADSLRKLNPGMIIMARFTVNL